MTDDKMIPFGYWHQGETEDESDFFLHENSGDVSCERCIKLFTESDVDKLQQQVLDLTSQRDGAIEQYLNDKNITREQIDALQQQIAQMRETLPKEIEKLILGHRLSYTLDEDDGGGYPLVDALTHKSEATITTGIEEATILSERVICLIHEMLDKAIANTSDDWLRGKQVELLRKVADELDCDESAPPEIIYSLTLESIYEFAIGQAISSINKLAQRIEDGEGM